jgi:uncharacterized membrane protein
MQRQRFALILSTVLFLEMASISSDAQSADFQARGNEPGWVVTVSDKAIELRTMDGKVTVISPKPSSRTKEDAETFEAIVDGQPFSLAISDRICHDTMSGMPQPKSVAISLGEWKQTGAGAIPPNSLKATGP